MSRAAIPSAASTTEHSKRKRTRLSAKRVALSSSQIRTFMGGGSYGPKSTEGDGGLNGRGDLGLGLGTRDSGPESSARRRGPGKEQEIQAPSPKSRARSPSRFQIRPRSADSVPETGPRAGG